MKLHTVDLYGQQKQVSSLKTENSSRKNPHLYNHNISDKHKQCKLGHIAEPSE